MSLNNNKTESEENKCGEDWLSDKYGSYLEKIRESVKKIYEEHTHTTHDLPFYTPHGIKHCEAVEDLLHRLIPEREQFEKLLEKERFYLLASAWLHDLGMLRMIAQEVYGQDPSSSEIRKKHHITTERFIVEQYTRCGLEEEDKEFLSKLCRYHRRQEDLNECDEKFMVGNEKYRLKLLSAYLRLADALHVGTSRTPTDAYVICLAYDIPSESKLHWIKSRLVNGIDINPKDHSITIEFRIPYREQIEENMPLSWDEYKYKIDYILKIVMDDLDDELYSVVNIMTREGPTYYLDIYKKRTNVVMSNQMLNDIRELVINYDIMVAPSASRLLEMILVTITNIAGYHIVKGKDEPIENEEVIKTNKENKKTKIDKFIESLENEILKTRSCHLGLKVLIDKCRGLVDRYLPEDFKDFIEKINNIYKQHHNFREDIRKNANNFFSHTYEEMFANKIDTFDNKIIVNIILFGYSELVVKAICGFRDFLIDQIVEFKNEYNDNSKNRKDFYNSQLEDKISKKIRIFICEGQPKTQTGQTDRLLYHDGSQYALALAMRNFKNLIIVPDIVIDNINTSINDPKINKDNPINLVMVGANGFTKDSFKHSAGHSSIVNIVREHQSRKDKQNDRYSKIVLVVSSEKWLPDNNDKNSNDTKKDTSPSDKREEKHDIEGYWFWQGEGKEWNEKISKREHIWILRDNNIRNKLYQNDIMFYNPREDTIPIKYVDYIISDVTHHKITAENENKIDENVNNFITGIKERREQIPI